MARCEFVAGFGAIIQPERFLEVFPMTPEDKENYLDVDAYLEDREGPEGVVLILREDRSIFVTSHGYQRGDEGNVVELDLTRLYSKTTQLVKYLEKNFPEVAPRLLCYTYRFRY